MTTRPLSTRLYEGGSPRLEIDAAEVRVAAGPDRGKKQPLGADTLVIGTAPDCGLVLHDNTVSARHAEIAVGPRGYSVRDLDSKNGVILEKLAVERAPLADGMSLRLGTTLLQVRALGGRTVVPLARPGSFHGMVAVSLRMRAVVATLERLAASDATVLLEGETGTGKEVAALALHRGGRRAGGPFVVFDCGAVPAELIASELFGHEKGAFSGATSLRRGLFEEADGGTLFLDEIGELPLNLQPTLLRALDRKSARRVGGNVEISHDVRLIAATNRNLAEEVELKRFRQDLFYRLAVARVRLPPLRERPEDIPSLSQAFAAELGVPLSAEIVAILSAHQWPGNVRELRNVVLRAAVDRESLLAHLPDAPAPVSRRHPLLDGEAVRPLPEARQLADDDFERLYVEEVLGRAGDNVSRAADLAGVSRQHMTRLVAKHGLRGAPRR